MAAYRRFVIYLYWCREGKVQNVGFSKIELQNSQCRIEIHVKGLPQKETELPVYLLHREEKDGGEAVLWGIELGNIGIRRGSGSFGRHFSGARIAGSPFSYQDMGGLLIPLQEDEMIAGQWDNKDIIRQQFQVWKPEQIQQMPNNPEQFQQISNSPGQNQQTPNNPEQIQQISNNPEQIQQISNKPELIQQMPNNPGQLRQMPNNPGQIQQISNKPEHIRQISNNPGITAAPEIEKDDLISTEENLHVQQLPEKRMENNSEFKNVNQPPLSAVRKNFSDWEQMWRILSGSRERFAPMEQKDAEAVKIDLKDLHLLPGELWNLGNNSFLLHGFFNYRFLLYGRMAGENGTPYYFIGVPGVFSNQEKVLAAIFGFPEFYLEKPAEIRTGKSGYWCKLLLSSDSNA